MRSTGPTLTFRPPRRRRPRRRRCVPRRVSAPGKYHRYSHLRASAVVDRVSAVVAPLSVAWWRAPPLFSLRLLPGALCLPLHPFWLLRPSPEALGSGLGRPLLRRPQRVMLPAVRPPPVMPPSSPRIRPHHLRTRRPQPCLWRPLSPWPQWHRWRRPQFRLAFSPPQLPQLRTYRLSPQIRRRCWLGLLPLSLRLPRRLFRRLPSLRFPRRRLRRLPPHLRLPRTRQRPQSPSPVWPHPARSVTPIMPALHCRVPLRRPWSTLWPLLLRCKPTSLPFRPFSRTSATRSDSRAPTATLTERRSPV